MSVWYRGEVYDGRFWRGVHVMTRSRNIRTRLRMHGLANEYNLTRHSPQAIILTH